MDQIAHAGDVRHRVQSPHLVEVDLPYGNAVGLGLRLGDEAIDSLGPLPDLRRQGEAVDHRQHVRQRAVLVGVRMSVVVVMFVTVGMLVVVLVTVVVVVVMTMGLPLLPAADQDGHVGTGDALAAGRLGADLHPGKEGVHIR